MEIRQVNINHIQIPEIKAWQFEVPVINKVPKPIINYAGCVKVHRNNLINLIDVDENGTVIKCGVKMPSYEPLQWTPNSFVYSSPPQNTNISPPSYMEAVKPEIPNKKKEKEFFIECPNETNLRIGNYANELKLEKVVGHKLSEDGRICYEVFAQSSFREKWIPSTPLLVNTSIIAITAASSPLIANAVKALVKNIIKRLKSKGTKTSEQD